MRGKHALIMLTCCAVPLAAIVAVKVFNVPIGTLGTYALFLLCPLGHLFLMRGMRHNHGGTTPTESPKTPEKSGVIS